MECSLRRFEQELGRLVHLLGEKKVAGDLLEVLVPAFGDDESEPCCGSFVEGFPFAEQHGLVGHVVEEGVLEGELRRLRETRTVVAGRPSHW